MTSITSQMATFSESTFTDLDRIVALDECRRRLVIVDRDDQLLVDKMCGIAIRCHDCYDLTLDAIVTELEVFEFLELGVDHES